MKPHERHDDLDAFLNKRALFPYRHELEDRIIHAAVSLPQQRRMPTPATLWQLLAECFTPRPAYALASAMAIGLMLGLGTVNTSVSITGGTDAVQKTAFYDTLYDEGETL
ncbi:hypothetical protein GC177_00380 [bacterium]|nr:hypothetical protein [bacterium]